MKDTLPKEPVNKIMLSPDINHQIDQKAQQCLKDRVSKAQIHNITHIMLGKTALRTVQ